MTEFLLGFIGGLAVGVGACLGALLLPVKNQPMLINKMDGHGNRLYPQGRAPRIVAKTEEQEAIIEETRRERELEH